MKAYAMYVPPLHYNRVEHKLCLHIAGQAGVAFKAFFCDFNVHFAKRKSFQDLLAFLPHRERDIAKMQNEKHFLFLRIKVNEVDLKSPFFPYAL